MDFYKVVDQAEKLLQQRGRLTYRSLQRQFDLDDKTLEDLKEELLFTYPVVDEDGRGLVWSGNPTASDPPSASILSSPAESAQQEALSSSAERRQLTVMFCDLVGSTSLAGELDPEDFREVVRAYQERAAGVIQQYEGHIAQYLGDGLLVYFGWPRAHEDDAQRAVHTGLGIVEAVDDLNSTLQTTHSVQLAVRLGVHTGPVVVGEMAAAGGTKTWRWAKRRILRLGWKGWRNLARWL